jgi:hypothetical protein
MGPSNLVMALDAFIDIIAVAIPDRNIYSQYLVPWMNLLSYYNCRRPLNYSYDANRGIPNAIDRACP